MLDLGKQVERAYPDHFAFAEVEWKAFPDGFPNLFIEDVHELRGKDVYFFSSLLDACEVFAQMAVMYSLPRYLVRSLTVVLPYFPTATMERIDKEGQVCTAMTLVRMLGAIPLTQSGAAKVMVYDIHTVQNRFYFGDSVIPLLVSAIPLFLDTLEKNHSHEEIAIAFPDAGARKRFGSFFSKYEVIVCSKIRKGDKREVRVVEGEPSNKHVFIVDDLVMSGGTLIECGKALKLQNASKLSIFVTHAIFPEGSWKKFTEKPHVFSKIYITDSVGRGEKGEGVGNFADEEPFHVIPLGESVGKNILSFCV